MIQITDTPLLTDFYQITMAYAYWKKGLSDKKAVFHSFFRRPPFKGGFTIACGLEQLLRYLDTFHFSKSDLDYLAQQKSPSGRPLFEEAFLKMLEDLRLSVDIDAVEEGTALFPYEPMVRVSGPLLQCQLLESPLLNLMNFPTLIATKAARIRLAAGNDKIMEFGLRRAQGVDGALTASRSAFIGGCDSTSHVLAGKIFGIPVQGTHAHSWIMSFEDEEEAFTEYAEVFPDRPFFLVDTYNTIEGVKGAIRVALRLKSRGIAIGGIRLDSGDLAALSIEARRLLDEAGLTEAKIIASNELDEVVISELKHQGAQIDIWGVGTNLVTAKDQPALDGVYKISAIEDGEGKLRYILKLSEQLAKVSNPGVLDILRFTVDGRIESDIIFDTLLGMPNPQANIDPFDPSKQINIPKNAIAQTLLKPVVRSGVRVYTSPSLQTIQKKTLETLQHLPKGVKRFLNPQIFPVAMEKQLFLIKTELMRSIRSRRGGLV